MRQGEKKAGLIALGRVRGHGSQRASQLLRGCREIAIAKEIGSRASRSSGEEWFKPALVERDRGVGRRWNGFLATRLRRSLFALGRFDGQGGAGQEKERESRTRVFLREHC